MATMALLPWILFGVMFLVGLAFAVATIVQTSKVGKARGETDAARMEVSTLERRAQNAEYQLREAQTRLAAAERQIQQAREGAALAQADRERAAAEKAEAERRAEEALERARRADASLQERVDLAAERERQAEARARGLLEWALQQHEERREPDRRQAQGQVEGFQAQLDAFIELRRAPVRFRTEAQLDRMASPHLARFAPDGVHVDVQGDDVSVYFPVDASQGFRA
jgi:type IV secretory pathway VirB10-like protein